jgi:disulfide bond formation protein DsbB
MSNSTTDCSSSPATQPAPQCAVTRQDLPWIGLNIAVLAFLVSVACFLFFAVSRKNTNKKMKNGDGEDGGGEGGGRRRRGGED